MFDPETDDDHDDETCSESTSSKRTSRTSSLRLIRNKKFATSSAHDPLEPLLELLSSLVESDEQDDEDISFDSVIQDLLPDLIHVRNLARGREVQSDGFGDNLRPLSRLEANSILANLPSDKHLTTWQALATRKLKLERQRHNNNLDWQFRIPEKTETLTPLPNIKDPSPNPQTLEALYAIHTTPYDNSFLSRIQGASETLGDHLACDWESRAPWMDLMMDIRDHYAFAHPERDRPVEFEAPIYYGSLQPWHLEQIHELFSRVFWAGINVSDSLDHRPEGCTVVATYKRLVVGAAILSSPQETYITYLAVKAGWDNAQIATSMLYHLITLNPRRDITLHVSTNNPAMLLYNRFGFKAEGFIAGFYEDYLDPLSRASKNAFRLRLRQ